MITLKKCEEDKESKTKMKNGPKIFSKVINIK